MGFLISFLFHIGATAGVIWGIENYLFVGQFSITGDDWTSYLLVALIFGTFNIVLKPLLKILMLPAQFLTLGLAGFAVNGILLWTVVETVKFLDFNNTQVQVENIFMYLVIGFILSIAHSIIHWVR